MSTGARTPSEATHVFRRPIPKYRRHHRVIPVIDASQKDSVPRLPHWDSPNRCCVPRKILPLEARMTNLDTGTGANASGARRVRDSTVRLVCNFGLGLVLCLSVST